MNPTTWLDAGAQVFYSFSLAFGGLISFSSYNSVHNNCEQDAIIISIINGCTSVYSATVIYSIIGFRAMENYDDCVDRNIMELTNAFHYPENSITDANYDDVLKFLNSTNPTIIEGLPLQSCDLHTLLSQGVEGTGLAFIVFTEAIIKMPFSPLWSRPLLHHALLPGTLHHDLNILPKKCPKEVFTAITCVVSGGLGLIFAMRSGNHWLALFDTFAGSIPPPGHCLRRDVFRGVHLWHRQVGIKQLKFNEDIEFMIGHRPNIFWQVTWRVVSPLIMAFIFVFYMVNQVSKNLTYLVWDQDALNPQAVFPTLAERQFPGWIYVIIFILAGVPSLSIPVYAFYKLIRNNLCKQKDNFADTVETVSSKIQMSEK
ncbi:Sodium-dependent neutral amino acid transporter B(0)AT1 [Merluccius polli]|uniref:Sodium-dependent neutral amino acid transporter B(0)AT1 n=1 Tax=Merluccius polli TaxID=89951 RepID=A0AA47N9B9_MERPO|nr:Sodium-dependent neutral amino acid transporter B(0)AT1 [Merluccius polli]